MRNIFPLSAEIWYSFLPVNTKRTCQMWKYQEYEHDNSFHWRAWSKLNIHKNEVLETRGDKPLHFKLLMCAVICIYKDAK